MKVWLDFNDDSLALPVTDGSIFAKVSRMSAPITQVYSSSSTSSLQSEYNNSAPKLATSGGSQPSIVNAAPTTAQQPAAQVNKPTPAAPARRNSEKLIKFDDDIDSPHPAAAPIPATAAASSG